MNKAELKAKINAQKKLEYVKMLEEAAKKTGIPDIMNIINATDCNLLVECFGENPTPESLIEIYNEYYKEEA